jgi:hypothetical protein
VAQKDVATLTTLMMPSFNFISRAECVTVGGFRGVRRQWGSAMDQPGTVCPRRPKPLRTEGCEHPHTRLAMHANPDHLQLPGDLPAGPSPPLALEEHDHADEIVRCRELFHRAQSGLKRSLRRLKNDRQPRRTGVRRNSSVS